MLQQQRPAVAKLLRSGRLSAQDMLVASAAAWALDVPADLIRAGVKSFGQTPPSPY